jgi:uncharacterized protein with PQ loop repeat
MLRQPAGAPLPQAVAFCTRKRTSAINSSSLFTLSISMR